MNATTALAAARRAKSKRVFSFAATRIASAGSSSARARVDKRLSSKTSTPEPEAEAADEPDAEAADEPSSRPAVPLAGVARKSLSSTSPSLRARTRASTNAPSRAVSAARIRSAARELSAHSSSSANDETASRSPDDGSLADPPVVACEGLRSPHTSRASNSPRATRAIAVRTFSTVHGCTAGSGGSGPASLLGADSVLSVTSHTSSRVEHVTYRSHRTGIFAHRCSTQYSEART